MPCNSDIKDEEDALSLVEHLGIDYEIVDLTNTYRTFLAVNGIEEKVGCMSCGNVKPRLRMTTLYLHAALNNYLVIGTSNRSELITGYFTKYGDGGVDFEPIADLLKEEVYEVGRIFNIPTSIMEKKPSAGLVADQDDESELGFTYEELDGFIKSGEGNKATIDKIMKLYNSSRHKFKIPDQLDLNRNFYIK